ncbi:hypothetical protein AWB79_00949 [Caballeronia hypogeia]|uniref:Uncharacterized protein n=1 Tax=Caballeronia hypogeia TaxID=1777140 RepID=A0A157ZI52_9BURK|nr:hypothetical protein AWB79_00949 [Caballeronia hypogeia]
MIPALLETIGALSLLVSVVAKVALLRVALDEDSEADAPVRHACAACCRQKQRSGDAGRLHEVHHRERRARCVAGRVDHALRKPQSTRTRSRA